MVVEGYSTVLRTDIKPLDTVYDHKGDILFAMSHNHLKGTVVNIF